MSLLKLVYSNLRRINGIGVYMKAEEFRWLTAELEKLTPYQKQLLTDRLRIYLAYIWGLWGRTRLFSWRV